MMCVKTNILREEKFLARIVERKQAVILGLLTSLLLSHLNVLAEKNRVTPEVSDIA